MASKLISYDLQGQSLNACAPISPTAWNHVRNGLVGMGYVWIEGSVQMSPGPQTYAVAIANIVALVANEPWLPNHARDFRISSYFPAIGNQTGTVRGIPVPMGTVCP